MKQSYLETNFLSLIKPEIKALAERGNVTVEEWKKLRMNSYERNYLLPFCNDYVIIEEGAYYLSQIHTDTYPSTYNEAIVVVMFPIVLQRMETLRQNWEALYKENWELKSALKEQILSTDPTEVISKCDICGKEATEDNWVSTSFDGKKKTCEKCHKERIRKEK